MTNEEKAKEILGCPCYVKRVCKSYPTLCDNCEEKRDLLQMAQWKDEQFAKQMTDDERLAFMDEVCKQAIADLNLYELKGELK